MSCSCMPRQQNPRTLMAEARNLTAMRQHVCAALMERFRRGGVSLVIPESGEGDEADPHFELDEPLGPFPGLPGNLQRNRQWSLFAETGKMSAASFSLPAGPAVLYGSCPAALTMQIVSTAHPGGPEAGARFVAEGERKIGALLARTPGRGLPATVSAEHSICSKCYAMKGNYGGPTTQIALYLRDIWVRSWFSELLPLHCRCAGMAPEPAASRGGARESADRRRQQWVERMVRAISQLLGNLKARRAAHQDPSYFRLHDSGDFFSIEYLRAWLEIAASLPHVHFWAPTRTWVLPHHRVLMVQAPPNLVIRPSAFQFGDPPPELPGFPAGSGSVPIEIGLKKKIWRCPALLADGHTCGSARGPECVSPCRVCWDEPGRSVDYATH